MHLVQTINTLMAPGALLDALIIVFPVVAGDARDFLPIVVGEVGHENRIKRTLGLCTESAGILRGDMGIDPVDANRVRGEFFLTFSGTNGYRCEQECEHHDGSTEVEETAP